MSYSKFGGSDLFKSASAHSKASGVAALESANWTSSSSQGKSHDFSECDCEGACEKPAAAKRVAVDKIEAISDSFFHPRNNNLKEVSLHAEELARDYVPKFIHHHYVVIHLDNPIQGYPFLRLDWSRGGLQAHLCKSMCKATKMIRTEGLPNKTGFGVKKTIVTMTFENCKPSQCRHTLADLLEMCEDVSRQPYDWVENNCWYVARVLLLKLCGVVVHPCIMNGLKVYLILLGRHFIHLPAMELTAASMRELKKALAHYLPSFEKLLAEKKRGGEYLSEMSQAEVEELFWPFADRRVAAPIQSYDEPKLLLPKPEGELSQGMEVKDYVVVPAREMVIIWGENSAYWEWQTDSTAMCGEAAKLLDVCWFEVKGEIQCQLPRGSYNFAWQLKQSDSTKNLSELATFCITIRSTGQEIRRNLRFDQVLPQPGRGWGEFVVGNLVVGGAGDEVIEFSITETKTGHWKRGVCIDCFLVYPFPA